MKESIEDVAQQIVHEMERYLNTLWDDRLNYTFAGFVGYRYRHDCCFYRHKARRSRQCSSPCRWNIRSTDYDGSWAYCGNSKSVFLPFFTRRVDELLNIMEQEALKLVEVLSSDITNRGDLSRHLGQEDVNH